MIYTSPSRSNVINFIHSCTHSFNKCLFSTWSVPGHLLGAKDPSENKILKTLMEFIFWWNSPLDSPLMELHTTCCYSFVWSFDLVFSSSRNCTSRIPTVLTHKMHSIHICWMNRLVNSQSFISGLWASSNCSWTLRTINRFACLEITNGHCFLDRKLQSQDSNSVSLTQKSMFYSLRW